MKRAALVLALLAILCGALSAQPPAPDPSHAKDGSFEIDLIATREGNELLTKWATGAPNITIRNLETAERNEFITVIVRFLGCSVDAGGLCDAVVDYTAYAPDGSVYGDMKGAELWMGKAAPDPGYSQLAAQYLGLVIEPQDPAGSYRLTAEVTDRISGKKLPVERRFSVR